MIVGADGGLIGVTELLGADDSLVPFEFVAVTVIV